MEKSNLRIAIIGAGNMGGAIARALISGNFSFSPDLHVSDVSKRALEALSTFSPEIRTTNSNVEAVKDADLILLAVKPNMLERVAHEINHHIDYKNQIIVSIAAGVDFKFLSCLFTDEALLFRVIPNTAIDLKQSVSIISAYREDNLRQQLVEAVFAEMGKVFVVPESQLDAYMSLSSCGIAYALRYIRAAMEGGVEMGIPAQRAKEVVIQTLRGAISLMETNQTHPEVEIDRVTTPGGTTIKGLNEMEANGFSNAVIKGLKASWRS